MAMHHSISIFMTPGRDSAMRTKRRDDDVVNPPDYPVANEPVLLEKIKGQAYRMAKMRVASTTSQLRSRKASE